MGNPASVTRKKTEKRRKRYEDRLGPGVYLPKEQREQLNAEMVKVLATEKERLAKVSKEREEKRAKVKQEKKAKAAAAAAKPAEEKPKA